MANRNALCGRRRNNLGNGLFNCHREFVFCETLGAEDTIRVAHLLHAGWQQCKKDFDSHTKGDATFKVDEGMITRQTLECAECGVAAGGGRKGGSMDIPAQEIHENGEFFGEVDERRARESNDLRVACGSQHSVEEISTLVVCLIRPTRIIRFLTQSRNPPLRINRLKRNRAAFLGRKRHQIRLNGSLHQARQIVNLVHDDNGIVKRTLFIGGARHLFQLCR